jgi:type IV pilus assembly protein PilB|tara:strand:- start:187 stop:1839 length:1653 start_codon:yes stop_codon:yes gene_type:complete
MAITRKKNIGLLLLEAGILEPEQLEQALLKQSKEENSGYLGEVLINADLIDEKTRNRFLSQQLHIPTIDLGHFEVDESVLSMIPERIVREYNVLPVFKLNNTLNVAITDPIDSDPINAARNASGLKAEPLIVTENELQSAIDIYYGMSTLTTFDDNTSIEDIDDTRIVQLVDNIIENSARYRASDIHIETRENDIRVRFRIDGKLIDFQTLPVSIATPLISRIKIMGNMDIAESRRPQDGRILFELKNDRLDLRVSTYPTLYGEKSVLRLLNISEAMHDLDGLGFEKDILNQFEDMLIGGEGIVLVSGPTGSGKTTTLYSTLNKMDKPDVNIVTIEDPIEFDLDNINQAQVNRRSGVTFASALRAILRQDPDIIMVGEVRDEETVELAIRAALTGHLVFSTIHTNDSAAGFTRLLNWGLEPFLITSTVKGILSQRLVRKLCKECREKHMVGPEELTRFGLEVDESMEFYRAVGCLSCRNTGYRGRVGLFELIRMNNKIADLVMEQQPGHVIREQAIKSGMFSLIHDGLIKAQRGDTSLQEILETLGSERV